MIKLKAKSKLTLVLIIVIVLSGLYLMIYSICDNLVLAEVENEKILFKDIKEIYNAYHDTVYDDGSLTYSKILNDSIDEIVLINGVKLDQKIINDEYSKRIKLINSNDENNTLKSMILKNYTEDEYKQEIYDYVEFDMSQKVLFEKLNKNLVFSEEEAWNKYLEFTNNPSKDEFLHVKDLVYDLLNEEETGKEYLKWLKHQKQQQYIKIYNINLKLCELVNLKFNMLIQP